ncbi:MAG: SDR family oxidoreductase [Candidatus Aureabacteria bacterium]|nr:SDR family oxidoreductase [Candidatus Auribacterota bacterium]
MSCLYSGTFKGKHAVIIGGSSGLGLEIARGFLTHGAHVCISGRSVSRLKKALSVLRKEGLSELISCPVDVTSYDSVRRCVGFVLKQFHSVDILVCTAGTYLKSPALEMTPGQWRTVLETNLTGTYYSNILFGKKMLEQRKGCIINTASLGSRVALSNTTAYDVSKSGVEMLTKCLAVEWAPYQVRVNALLPGVFKTNLNEKALRDRNRAENILHHTPLKRFGRLPEIVSAALFLASDSSSFVTGTSVIVDGGFLAYAGF